MTQQLFICAESSHTYYRRLIIIYSALKSAFLNSSKIYYLSLFISISPIPIQIACSFQTLYTYIIYMLKIVRNIFHPNASQANYIFSSTLFAFAFRLHIKLRIHSYLIRCTHSREETGAIFR